MELKKFVVAAALGATVLTAVPALVAPQEAAAGCWGDSYSDCTPDDPGPGDGGGGDWGGGGGGGDWGGGGGGGGGGGTYGLPNVSEGEIGDYLAGSVTIVGRREGIQFYPDDPRRETEFWGDGIQRGGGGGGGVSAGAVVHSQGQKWNERQNCLKNPGEVPTKITQGVNYQVSFKASANLSAKASEVLSGTLNAELNSSITRSYNYEVTINPGQTWALNVEYQTVTYAITTANWLGMYTTDYVNVTGPTGTVLFTTCN
ncbi:DUF6426 family protein [Kitasatospora sp. CM 4170]|uniref:DUF6426 family protein n=1 Tax=Kitasatospora aburaviensis TaxID=67265 RepID=A0ABW1EXD5_9ACTN|nr:DUF6426 family protein [Kitasatospora sp. CM 4170]WNM43689.1 DUF6426 family protein [Kitasatospora sp. CM 4170]